MTLFELIDKLSPLIGVLIGVTLSPILSNYIDKAKRKRTLRRELAKNIYIFYNLLKINSSGHFNHNFLIKRHEVYNKLGLSTTNTEDEFNQNKTKVDSITLQLNEVEAELT